MHIMERQIQLAAEVQRNVLAALVEDIGGGDLTALLYLQGYRQSEFVD